MAIHRIASFFGFQRQWELQSQPLLLGVFEPGVYKNVGRYDLEQTIGRSVDIVHVYQGWGAGSRNVDPGLLQRNAERGSLTMITWEPWDYTRGQNQPEYRLKEIASGRYGEYVAGWARELKAFGKPVFLRFTLEMNQAKYPWAVNVNDNTVSEYVAVWRYLHDIFAREGAGNVRCVWSPGVGWNAETDFSGMYPGDDYVDWLGLDVYNTVEWGGWRRFDEIAGPSLHQLSLLSAKPIMLAELGCSDDGGDKAAWILDTFNRIPRQFPRIRAAVWFNDNADGQDWRIETGPPTMRAMSQSVSTGAFAWQAQRPLIVR